MPINNIIGSTLAFITLILFWFLGYEVSQYVDLPASLLGLLLLFMALYVDGMLTAIILPVLFMLFG